MHSLSANCVGGQIVVTERLCGTELYVNCSSRCAEFQAAGKELKTIPEIGLYGTQEHQTY